MKYRSDIDGLRAVAILPVVLFHLDISWISGGFVGVDIFFVISGYLITSVIFNDLVNGTFSYSYFFFRRVRRLFPAAFVVYLFTLSTFIVVYPNTFFEKVAITTLSSLFFVSNLYFWQQGGYFSDNLELNPLLHTWSLSVEEQFYLFFPLALIVLFKYIKPQKLVLLMFIFPVVMSLCLAIYFTPSSKSFAGFYLLPTRVYELGAGALLAAIIRYGYFEKHRKLTLLRNIGFTMTICAIFGFDATTPFPSYSALLPVVGTCLIIFTNSKSGLIYRLLVNRGAVFIGLISYSMYLWHWPLIVLKNWLFDDHYPNIMNFTVLATTTFLAFLTYRFIETPYRSRKLIPDKQLKRRAIWGYITLVIFSSTVIFTGNDFITDPHGDISAKYELTISPEPFRKECTNRLKNSKDSTPCLIGKEKQGTKNILVWGDSHGGAFIPTLMGASERYNIYFFINTGCPPVYNLTRPNSPFGDCEPINNAIWEHVQNNSYDLILVVGAFNNYLNWELIGHSHQSDLSSLQSFETTVGEQINLLKNINTEIAFIPQAPRFKSNIPENWLRMATLNYKGDYPFLSNEEYETQLKEFSSVLNDDMILFPARTYCINVICDSVYNDNILYKDSHHISNFFAELLAPTVDSAIAERLNPSF
ncbi:acyltransferase family protein [Alteromonas sp. 1_MG-2023]|uniref:acyltransferase family protein n=1 Tax=Alteromonas sp. 1_MG-2023 TaxID=3062669 RepID=UPI0026E25472|nr:acyltransferase family protein [Alteromonas sp. 1_MG-2023]MDO6566325.1 acyltransferase family protein [Alteromonas sp. 1_MG-2023]